MDAYKFVKDFLVINGIRRDWQSVLSFLMLVRECRIQKCLSRHST